MKFIEYLYFKYYTFQVKVGNKDVAPFSSMLIIAFTFMLYYFSIIFLILIFIPKGIISTNLLPYSSIVIFFALIIWLYFLLLNKGKYKKILNRNEKYNSKRGLQAILFPLVAFVLFNIAWILKMLQNQGGF